MTSAALTALYDAVCAKLKRLRSRHLDSVSTLTELDASVFSIDYSTMKLPRSCRHVKLWYSRDIIRAYRQILRLWKEFNEDDYMSLKDIVDDYELYVIGWDRGREMTGRNLMTLETNAKERLARVRDLDNRLETAIRSFDKLNRDPSELVDSVVIPLYHNTEDFSYQRAYAHFFKRAQIQEGRLQRILEEDFALIDRLLELAAVLYRGYDRTGRGDDFELYRRQQQMLLMLAETYNDVIETHIGLLKGFSAVRRLIIAFKIYPYDKDTQNIAGHFGIRR